MLKKLLLRNQMRLLSAVTVLSTIVIFYMFFRSGAMTSAGNIPGILAIAGLIFVAVYLQVINGRIKSFFANSDSKEIAWKMRKRKMRKK